MGNLVDGHIDHFSAVHLDRSGARPDQPENGFQGSGTSGPVAAQQGDDFTFAHRQVHPVQNVGLAIPGMQVFNFKEFRTARVVTRHRLSPYKLP